MDFTLKYYGEDSHGSVPLITEYDALRYIFKYYRMEYDPAETAETLTRHYEVISDKLGYTKLPPESLINDKGHMYLNQKKFEQARSFFELNLRNYGKSSNAHASMGDYYLGVGDTTNAKGSLIRSLELKEDETTRKKLKAIEN